MGSGGWINWYRVWGRVVRGCDYFYYYYITVVVSFMFLVLRRKERLEGNVFLEREVFFVEEREIF